MMEDGKIVLDEFMSFTPLKTNMSPPKKGTGLYFSKEYIFQPVDFQGTFLSFQGELF